MGISNIPKGICDVASGIANMGSSEELFKKHLLKFMDNNELLADRIQTLVDDSEYHKAAVLCHSVKGVSGMLALTTINSHTASAEAIFKECDNPDQETKQLIELAITGIRADIEELLSYKDSL
jgi:HPt (histidine-containing phosphotransfer) domain-containing protein